MKVLALFLFIFISFTAFTQEMSEMIDPRDGQAYQTVIIQTDMEGDLKVEREWMAENLKYDMGEDASYCYKDYKAYCQIFGRLYTWEAAREACPEGWHLPTLLEWQQVYKTFGGKFECGSALREGGESGLNLKMSGFGELDGLYIDIGISGYFWAVENWKEDRPGLITVNHDIDEISDTMIGKAHKNACRCVKDYPGFKYK